MAAILAAGLGVGVTAIADPVFSVGAELPGGVVLSVLPGGPSWRAGIRVGQQVLVLGRDPELGWNLATWDGTHGYDVAEARQQSSLADARLLAGVAAVLALAGLAIRRIRPRPAYALLALGAVIGAEVSLLSGSPAISTLAAVLGSAAVAGLVALSGPQRWRLVSLLPAAAIVLVGVGWVVARFATPQVFDVLDGARRGTTVAAGTLLAVVALSGGVQRLLASPPRVAAVDLVFVVALTVIGLLLWRIPLADPAQIIGLAAVAVAGYAVARGVAVQILDRVVLAEARERSRIRAIEEERQRLARELHDEPLQHLAGVIKDLEREGAARDETSALMAIADELRGLATGLRPPVIDDLGLVPALTTLAVEGPIPVTIDLDDRTGYAPGSRLPADVELALYRIVAEAVRNAVSHSGGSHVRVTGSVAPDRATIQVADDGRGMEPETVRTRQLDGHLGLSTMRQRATLVGAELVLDSSPHGVTVRATWQRR